MSFVRHLLLIVLAAVAVLPVGVRGQAISEGSAFDATYYHLNLDLDIDAHHLAGRVLVEGRAVGTPLDTLVLDLDDGMQVSTVRTPDGTQLPFTHAADLLRIDVPGAPVVGSRVAVVVEYAGRPDAAGNAFVFGRLSNGDAYAWSLSEPYGAREWWPCQDHPSDKADSVRVTVTVPAGMEVASNGLLQSVATEAGRTTFDWFSRYRITTYLVSVAAGHYVQTEQTYRRPDSLAARYGALELPILHYRYAARNDALPDGWAEVADAMAVLEHWFGPYPFAAEKYGHAEFTRGGGMEHQTISSMGGTSVQLVVHELAHQWFGDLVTTRTWPHLWLNEGFATYAEALYWKSQADRYPGQYASKIRNILESARAAQGTLVVEDTTSVSNLFAGSRVYNKGAAVLYMLHRLVGDDTFRAILHAYAADPSVRYGTATSADFQRVAEAVAGRDFDAFFRQWVTEGTGEPAYRVRWSSVPGPDGYTVHLRIEQMQEGLVFEMPVELAVKTEAGIERVVIDNEARVQETTVAVEARPVAVRLDPDDHLLRAAWVDVARTDVPAPEAPHVFPDPATDRVTIRYTLAADSPVRLTLYDMLGREQAVLLDAPLQPAGVLHAHTFDTSTLAAGTYFLRLEHRTGVVTRSLVVL